MRNRHATSKRILDMAGAAVLLVVTAPVMAVIGALMWLQLGSPVVFRQVRPGLDREPFTLYKFRTMTNSRGPEGELLPDEERLTRFGKWLRSTSLDELPELVNVLRGDMSLVGPRPLLMEYLGRYTPRHDRRHEVKPGITGLAQVSGRNDLSWHDKLELDVHYIERQSLWLDAKILARTVWYVLRRTGISAEGHATTPKFDSRDEDCSLER